jgi:hypothetical protein
MPYRCVQDIECMNLMWTDLVGEGWAVHTNAGAHLTTIDVKTAHDKDLLPLAGKKGPEVAGIIDPEPSRDRHEKTSMRCQQIPHVL